MEEPSRDPRVAHGQTPLPLAELAQRTSGAFFVISPLRSVSRRTYSWMPNRNIETPPPAQRVVDLPLSFQQCALSRE